jgi:predicted RNA methylase
MLRMTPPLIAWAQAVALMVVGTQAMMLPPAFLPTPPTIKKEARKDEAGVLSYRKPGFR